MVCEAQHLRQQSAVRSLDVDHLEEHDLAQPRVVDEHPVVVGVVHVRGTQRGRRASRGEIVEFRVLQPSLVSRERTLVQLRHGEPSGWALGAIRALTRVGRLRELRHVPKILGHLVDHELACGARHVRIVCVGRPGLEPEHAADVIGDWPNPPSPRVDAFFDIGVARGGRAGSRQPRAVALRIRRRRRLATQLDLRRGAESQLATGEDVGRRELRGCFIRGRGSGQVLGQREPSASERDHRILEPPPELLPLYHQRHHDVRHGEGHEDGVNLNLELHGVYLLLLRTAGVPGLHESV